jgi:hypothetical protein
MVQFDDLRARHVLRRLCRKPHHEDGADREVRREEDGHAGLDGQRRDLVRVPARGADDARDAGLERALDVLHDDVRRREVDHRVRLG